MERRGNTWTRVGMIAGLCAVAGMSMNCSRQADKQAGSVASAKPSGQVRSIGKDASLTVLPVRLDGQPSERVGEVVGLFLERGGMTNLETESTEFRPPDGADLAKTGAALGEFVKAHPLKTDYALFADVLASPQRKVIEVRGVIVDKQGTVVWQDRQTPDDADFKRINPKEPMECCLLLTERLKPELGLVEPTREDASQGKITKRWKERTGLPSDADRDAMKERQQAFKKSAAKATLLIYPVRAGDAMSKDNAARLAQLINQDQLMKATAADKGPEIAVKHDPNEQSVLWNMARGFREQAQKLQPDADYVLYADYLMGPGAVGAVHFAICDRQGQWVVVDFQNSHHDDFRAIKPKSAEDCDRLLVKRLRSYCQ